MGKVTDNVKKNVKNTRFTVPWIIINGEHNKDAEKKLTKVVCDAWKVKE